MADTPSTVSTPNELPPLDTGMAYDPRTATETVAIDVPQSWQLWSSPMLAWNPVAIQAAKTAADQGNLEYAADLWECQLGDDRIGHAMEQRILASEGLPVSFIGSPRGAKRLEKLWPDLVFSGIRAQLLKWGLGMGVVPLYVREWKDGNPIELEIWHPRWLRFFWNERRWKILGVQGFIDLASQPGRWYLFAPYGDPLVRPWVDGLWYSTATKWLQKSFATADAANFGQQHASPKWFMEQIEQNASIPKTAKQEALKWLARIPNRATMFVPFPFKVTQHETSSQSWQIYMAQMEDASRALTRRILGSDAASEKDSTHASGLTALDVKLSLVKFDVGAERDFWKRGLIKTWVQVQGLSGPVPYPDRDTTPPEDLEKAAKTQLTTAQALTTLTDSGLGGDIDERAYLGRVFPLRDRETGEGDNTTNEDGIQLSHMDLEDLPDTCTVRLSGKRVFLLSGDPGEEPVTLPLLLGKDRTDFPRAGDNQKVSLRNSQWGVFDPEYAADLKENWPEIWKAGGNIRGNSQYRVLLPVVARSGVVETPGEEEAVRLREAWGARHYRNKNLAGVIALIKWFVVGGIGASEMKAVIQERKDYLRRKEKASRSQSLEIPARKPRDVRKFAREGLEYRDTVTDTLLAGDLGKDPAAQVLKVLSEARDYEDARQRLAAAFPGLDRTKLRDCLAGGLLLTQAAGRLTAGKEAE